MGNPFKRFFKAVFKGVFVAASIILTVGTGGIGGAGAVGFWKAVTNFGLRRIFGLAAIAVVAGVISDALRPRVRRQQPQSKLPVFSSISPAQNIIGKHEASGLITYIHEDDDESLYVTYTIADHPLRYFIGVRIMGTYTLFNDPSNPNKGQIAWNWSVQDEKWRNLIFFHWNFSGKRYDEVSEIAKHPEGFDGNGVSWVCVEIRRRREVVENGFNLDGFRFHVVTSEYAFRNDGENPAQQVASHLINHFQIHPGAVNREALNKAAGVCDRTVGSPPQRVNGRWQAGTEYEVLDQLLAAMDGVMIQAREIFYIHANPLSSDEPTSVVIPESALLDEVVSTPLNTWDNLYNSTICTYNSSETGEPISSPRYVFKDFLESDADEFGDNPHLNDQGHFQFVSDEANAKRIAVQRTARSRHGTQVYISVLEGTVPELRTWDRVRLNMPSAGLKDDGTEYRIIGMTISVSGRMDIILQREALANWYPQLYTDDNIIIPEIRSPNFDPDQEVIPDSPKGITASSVTTTTAVITWGAVPEAIYYVVYWRDLNEYAISRVYKQARVEAPTTTYTLTGLRPDWSYAVNIRAFTETGGSPLTGVRIIKGGGVTGTSQTIVVNTRRATRDETTAPAAPTNFRITRTYSGSDAERGFDFSWDQSARAHTYILYRRRLSPRAETQYSISYPETANLVRSWRIAPSDIEPNVRYSFYVVAKNNIGNSTRSNVITRSLNLARNTFPAAVIPRITSVRYFQPSVPQGRESASDWNIEITWSSSSANKRYQLEFKNSEILNGNPTHRYLVPNTYPETDWVIQKWQGGNSLGETRISRISTTKTKVLLWRLEEDSYGRGIKEIYRWKFRVRGIDGGNRYSSWSPIYTFTANPNTADPRAPTRPTTPTTPTTPTRPTTPQPPPRREDTAIPRVDFRLEQLYRYNSFQGKWQYKIKVTFENKTGYTVDRQIRPESRTYSSAVYYFTNWRIYDTNGVPVKWTSPHEEWVGSFSQRIYVKLRYSRTSDSRKGEWTERSITRS